MSYAENFGSEDLQNLQGNDKVRCKQRDYKACRIRRNLEPKVI